MVTVSMLLHSEFGPSGHQKDAPLCTFCASVFFLPCALLGTRFMRIESGPFRFGSLKFPKLETDGFGHFKNIGQLSKSYFEHDDVT